MGEVLIGFGYLAAIVTTLIIAVAVASWLYRRDLDRRIRKGEPADASPISPATSGPRRSSRTTTVDEVRAIAYEITAQVSRAQLAAWLGYAAVTLFVVIAYLGMALVSIVGAVYAVIMPQLVILTWSLRWPRRRSLLTVLLFAAAGAVLLLPIWGHRQHLTVLSVCQLIVVFLIAPAAILRFLFARQLRAFVLLVLAVSIAFGGVALYMFFLRPETVPDTFREMGTEPLAVALGLVAVIAGVVIAVMLLRSRGVVRLAGFAAALAAAVILDRVFGRLPLPVLAVFAVAGIVVQVFILWASFKLLVSLHLTNELVQTHLCWILLTAYFAAATMSNFFAYPVSARWGLFLALVPYLVILHTLLFRIRKRPRGAPMRLLLLRVFGRADRHEDLLRDLDDTWRRVGAVDLIASTDVASRTLTSTMLEAFFLRRTDEEFLKTADEVDRRIKALRFDIEADARYPVNPVYCYNTTWKRAFTQLAAGADAVLMDLRGFTANNVGCALELEYLLRNFDLERIVLLTNSRTENAEIERIKREAGVERELDIGENPLFDRLLRAALS